MLMVRLAPLASTRAAPAVAGNEKVSGPAVLRISPEVPLAMSVVSILCQTPLASL